MKIPIKALVFLVFSCFLLHKAEGKVGDIQSYFKKGNAYLKNKPDSATFYFKKALRLSKRLRSDSLIAKSYMLLGTVYYEKGDYTDADSLFKLADEKIQGQPNKKILARLEFGKGSLQVKLGNHDLGVKHFMKAKKLFDESMDTLGFDEVDMSIAIMHMEAGELDKAKKILRPLIREYSRIEEDPLDISSTYGFLNFSEKEYDSAYYYFQKSLAYQKKQRNMDGVAVSYNNIGHALQAMKKYEEARQMFEKSLEVYQSIGSKHGEAFVRNSLGQSYYYLGATQEAIKQLTLAYELSAKLGLKSFTAHATNRLSTIYAEINQFDKAYEYLKLHKIYNDSTLNESSAKNIEELQTKFDFEKQETEMSALREKQRAGEENERKSAYIFNLMVVVVILVLAGLIFMAVVYRNNKIKNRLLAIKNMEIEQQNKEIKDSINYAKRIQKAILPPEQSIKNVFPESFVFYLPKDIVSGDFYWMELFSENSKSENGKEQMVCIAAADCTGHGVPGAMVSVVCHNALNRSVREYGLHDPGSILDKTREIVIQEFEKSDTDVKDGMDISLLSIVFGEKNNNTSPVSTLRWAGANNPLWMVRNGQIIEFRPNKQPIGKYAENKPFQTHDIKVEKGDTLYIFTDGLADQFGGDKGKKLKIAGLKHKILSMQHLSMSEQLKTIQRSFEEWKRGFEQIDDVCVIGIRL